MRRKLKGVTGYNVKFVCIFKLKIKMTRNFGLEEDFGLNCQVHEGIHSLPSNTEGDSKEKLGR